MSKYKSKLEQVLSSRQLHLLYDRLDSEKTPFSMRAKRVNGNIWKITLRTYNLNRTYFDNLFKSLKKAW